MAAKALLARLSVEPPPRTTGIAAVRWLLRTPMVAGTLAALVSTALTAGSGYLFWRIAARHFPAAPFGQGSAFTAAIGVVALIAGQTLGVNVLARLPRLEPERLGILTAALLGALVFGLAASVVAVVVIAPLSRSLSVLSSPPVAISFAVAATASAIGLVIDAAAIALRRAHVMTVRNAGHGLGKLALLPALLAAFPKVTGPVVIVGSWAAASVITSGWGACTLWRGLRGRGAPKWRRVLGGYGLQTVATLGGAVPPQLMPVIVAAALGAATAGIFSMAWLVGALTFIISPAVCSALLAEGSYHPQALRRRVRTASALIALLLTVPICLCLFASHPLLGLFGERFARRGSTLLFILALAAVPDAITNVAVSIHRVHERLREAAVINTTIAAVALLTAWPLLRSLGLIGAGWAWLAGQLAGVAMIAILKVLRSSPSRPAP